MLPLTGKRVLILDADGVLRRLPGGKTLDGLGEMEGFLREPEFADVLVVAAGKWKRSLSMKQIRGLFAPDLQERFVGATPDIDWTDRFRSHVEIRAWLLAHPEIVVGVVLESGYFWRQFPAMECAVFVPEGETLGSLSLESLRRIFRRAPPVPATRQ